MQKLYCYVDETGQDTQGELYIVVSVVISDQDVREEIERRLLEAEQQSGKRRKKWQKAPFNQRIAYLNAVLALPRLRRSLFYATYATTREYLPLTTYTIAQAIGMKTSSDYLATILIDGLNDRERERVTRGLRQLRISCRKIRGIRDEASPFIRLADAMAGFLRDHQERQPYTGDLYDRFVARQLLIRLE